MTNENDLIRRGDAMEAARAIIRRGDSDYRVGMSGFSNPIDAFEHAIANIPAVTADPVRVTVKPLVWFDCEDGTSHDEGCQYEIDKDSKQYWRIIRGVTGGASYLRHALSLEAAKAAAQADYEARILAAIDTHSDPQCCMCGKLGLSTAEDGGPECELHDGRWVCSSDCWNNASALAEATPPQPDPRDALIARLVEASEALRQDMMERARCGMDVIYGTEYRIVNAGRTAWDDFCDAIAAAKGGAA